MVLRKDETIEVLNITSKYLETIEVSLKGLRQVVRINPGENNIEVKVNKVVDVNQPSLALKNLFKRFPLLSETIVEEKENLGGVSDVDNKVVESEEKSEEGNTLEIVEVVDKDIEVKLDLSILDSLDRTGLKEFGLENGVNLGNLRNEEKMRNILRQKLG